MRVAASQPRDRVDDIPGAIAQIVADGARAEREGAALICFPECYLQGYVVDSTVTARLAMSLGSAAFTQLINATASLSPVLVVGFIERNAIGVFNSAAVLHRGKLVGVYSKSMLLRGEARVFCAGAGPEVFAANGLRFGINICNDLNFANCAAPVKADGGNLLVCPCNNMLGLENARIWKERHNAVRGERCRETGLPLLSSDVTGRRDDRVAWGPTALLGRDGKVISQAPLDQEALLIAELPEH